jgi:hypothetical protein
MAEFKTIETQEELDGIIRERLARNTESVEKRFEGYTSPEDLVKKTESLTGQINTLKSQLAEKDTAVADLTAKNKAYETASVKTRIAREYGLPYELADRLSGESEADIKKDAEVFSKFIGKSHTAPLGSTEKGGSDSKTAAYKNLLSGLKD